MLGYYIMGIYIYIYGSTAWAYICEVLRCASYIMELRGLTGPAGSRGVQGPEG